jgi:hypothetical protein
MNEKVVVDAGRFWIAALVCAVIAGLAGLVAFWAISDIGGINLFVRDFPDAEVVLLTSWPSFLVSFLMAIIAAGVLHLMMLFLVRPTWFFTILSLVLLAVAALFPYTIDVPTESQVWLMVLHTVVGVIIFALLLGTMPFVVKQADPPQISTGYSQ